MDKEWWDQANVRGSPTEGKDPATATPLGIALTLVTAPKIVRSEVVFLGGRSGVGKTTVAAELHAQLARLDVQHCWIEGDNLDMAYPTPWEQGHALAEANLAAMWHNYKAVGYKRLVYSNTAAVRRDVIPSLVDAMGDHPVVHAILLTSSDDEADRRLGQRELGSGLAWHSERSRRAAGELESHAPPWVQRVDTDHRKIIDIARDIIDFVGWDHQ